MQPSLIRKEEKLWKKSLMHKVKKVESHKEAYHFTTHAAVLYSVVSVAESGFQGSVG
jgi:nitrate reductase NapE component